MQVYKNIFDLLDLFQVLIGKTAISLLILINNSKIIARQNYGGYFRFLNLFPFCCFFAYFLQLANKADLYLNKYYNFVYIVNG